MIHGAIFAHAIERAVPGIKDIAIYRYVRWATLWSIIIAAVALGLALSVFLVWLWVVKLVVLGGAGQSNQSNAEILESGNQGHRMTMFEETDVILKDGEGYDVW